MGPTVKDSPPNSPHLENISNTNSGKRKRKSNENSTNLSSQSLTIQLSNTMPITTPVHLKEEKDIKVSFQNNINAPHMLGNQLNPSSSMAQKMSDTLTQELEAHSIFTEANNSEVNLVGPPLHNRVIASAKSSNTSLATNFTFSSNNVGPSNVAVFTNSSVPQTLDQLLERQWEQGSQFLMEQAQHFDIASLLSCLHQLRAENLRLEEHVNSLLQRRDHLLAVNARLAIPLTSNAHTVNNIHPNVSSSPLNLPNSEIQTNTSNVHQTTSSKSHRESRITNSYPVSAENVNISNQVHSSEQMSHLQYSQRPTSSNQSQQQTSLMRY